MEPFDLDIDSTNFTKTRIFKAIKARNHHKVLQAIYKGDNVQLKDPEFNTTYLHVVCSLLDSVNEEKYLPVIYQLSNAGVDVNARDYKGRTAFELAIGRELCETMVALIRCGADITSKDYKKIIRGIGSPFEYELINAIEKYEPGLWTCVLRNDTGMVHMLINSWCRVNINRQGVTLLQMARQTKKSQELISVLDDYEVTIEFVHATLAGDEKRMLEFLMDAKPCDPNIMDISYQERWSMPLEPRSLRDTAFCMGHTHILHLLPEDLPDDLSNGGGTQGGHRPTRHIRDKGRTDTVMAITSLNGDFPDGSDATCNLNNIGESEGIYNDKNSFDEIYEIPNEEGTIQKRPLTSRSLRYQTESLQDIQNTSVRKKNSIPNLNFSGSKTMQIHSASFRKNSKAKTFVTGASSISSAGGKNFSLPPGYGESEHYFNDVDGYTGNNYVEDGTDPPFKTYVCKPGSEHKNNHEYSKNSDKKNIKSKMCVIS